MAALFAGFAFGCGWSSRFGFLVLAAFCEDLLSGLGIEVFASLVMSAVDMGLLEGFLEGMME